VNSLHKMANFYPGDIAKPTFNLGYISLFSYDIIKYQLFVKGKPIEKWGRKATGLKQIAMMAGFPCKDT